MTNDTQQSKMRLSATEIKKFQFTDKQLKDIRNENKLTYQENSTVLIRSDRQREQNADNLFKDLFMCR